MKHAPSFRDQIHGAKIHLPNNHGDSPNVRDFYVSEVSTKLDHGKYAYHPKRDLENLDPGLSDENTRSATELLKAVQKAYVIFVLKSHDPDSQQVHQQALENAIRAFTEKGHEKIPHRSVNLITDAEINRLLTNTIEAANKAIEAVCPGAHDKERRRR